MPSLDRTSDRTSPKSFYDNAKLNDEFTTIAASDSQFELDLHGMNASDKMYKLTAYKPYAFTGSQYRAIQVYKRFLDDMQNKEDKDKAQKQLMAIENAMKVRTESYFSQKNLDAQIKAGALKSDEAAKILVLKQIFENQLALIERQRLNHVSTKIHFKNTSLAASAFHTTAAISNVLIAIANFVPVVNLFAHPLKLSLEMVNYSLLVAAYNLDPRMKEGITPYTVEEREEIVQRREAAKEHLQAIKTAKLKEITTGLLGSFVFVAAFFAGPLAPILASIGATGLLVSNIYAQKAIQAEIDLLKKVGIKRDKEGNSVYEDVTVIKDGKTIKIRQEVRLMKDYDLRLASLEAKLAGKKWNTYAAGTALGGTLGTVAIVGAVLLGAASAAFPPLLIAIAVTAACVTFFCAIRGIKKTYDEKQLAAKADALVNRDTETEMDKNLNTLSQELNIKPDVKEKLESSSESMAQNLRTLEDTLQNRQQDDLQEIMDKKVSHDNRNISTEPRLDLKLSQELIKEDEAKAKAKTKAEEEKGEKEKKDEEEGEGRAAKEKPH